MLKELLEGKNIRDMLTPLKEEDTTEARKGAESVTVELSEYEIKVGSKTYFVNAHVDVELEYNIHPEDREMSGDYNVDKAEVVKDDYLCIFTEDMLEIEEGEDECIRDKSVIKKVIKAIEDFEDDTDRTLHELAVDML